MIDIQLYTKLSKLPINLKAEVEDFIDFLSTKIKSKNTEGKREFGLAKGLIKMNDNFDDPIEDFKDYM